LNGLGDNTFAVGVNSGEAMVSAPQTEGAGAIQSGALELSNVELSREFINLITASTGFSAASRVVRSADDLLQELLLLAR
jgi:flagellar hook protein FlgE